MQVLKVILLCVCASLLTSVGKKQTDSSIERKILDVVHRPDDHGVLDSATVHRLHSVYRATKGEPEHSRMIASLALGVHYIESDYRLALQYLSSAEMLSGKEDGLIPIIMYFQATARYRGGAYNLAGKQAVRLLSEGLSSEWNKSIYKLIIESYYHAGDHKLVTRYYEKYARKVSVSRREDSLMKYAVSSYEQLKDYESATKTLEDLAANYPTTDLSRWAFQELQEYKCSNVFTYRYSLHFLLSLASNRTLDTGISEFLANAFDETLHVSRKKRPRKLDEDEKIEAFFKARMYEDALVLAEKSYEVARTQKDNEKIADLTILLGRIHFRLRDIMKASKYFTLFLNEFPQHRERYQVYEYLGDTYKRLDAFELAAEYYGKVARKTRRREMRWAHFWNYYRAGNYSKALNLIRTPKYVAGRNRSSGEDVLFWEARIMKKMGRETDSFSPLYELMQRHGSTFYALLAATQNAEVVGKHTDGEAVSDLRERTDERRFELAAKILDSKSEMIGAELTPELKSIYSLLEVGLTKSARKQLGGIKWRMYNDEEEFASIGEIAMQLDNYRPSSRLRHRVFSALNDTPSSWWGYTEHQAVHKKEWQIYFPEAFDNELDEICNLVGIDKYFVLSIMRAESYYNKDARSVVGARGLMQIMPYTGVRIANLLGDHNFEVSDLSKPRTNIAYGAYYLKKLLDYYQGNTILAMAAYNAGPTAVNRWIQYCKTCDMDDFIESIPYRETRRYVKKVSLNMANYRRVYRSETAPQSLPQLPKTIDYSLEIF